MVKLVKMMMSVMLAALVGLASARRSPNADFVPGLMKNRPVSRYSDNIVEDAALDVPGLISKYGYPQEVHHVTTSDGYILEAHRIPHGRDSNNAADPNKPVVFVMHGLLSSSADFLVLGPGNALAYLLAEAGYDVWLGNARGNYYSRRHVSLNPDGVLNKNFWRFSWDEIGNHDLPAFIDYILETTGQPKLHYIGHSQGGTSFLVLNSLRPEYNEKFITFQGLAPASFFDHNEVSTYRSLAAYENVIETAAFTMGYAEIFGNRQFVNWFQDTFCDPSESMFDGYCGGVLTDFFNRESYNATLFPVIFGHTPAGSSIRQVAHYGQVIRFNAFRRYNHGVITNLAVYRSTTPPTYDLSKVTAPAYIHYGLSDREVHYKDVYTLVDRLPNVDGVFQAERESFNHFDFIWANDSKELIYDKVIRSMKDAEDKFL